MYIFRVVLTAFITLLILATYVDGYGGGAPNKACVTMTPGHMWNATTPILPQDGESPYKLEVNADMVGRGQKVNVTVTGDVFEGYLIQVRSHDETSTTPIGTFTDIDEYFTEYRDCNSTHDSITHESPRPKASGTYFTWMAPSEAFGDVHFIATVLKNHEVIWVGIRSEVIKYGDVGPTAEPEPTTQAGTWVIPSMSSMIALLIATILIK